MAAIQFANGQEIVGNGSEQEIQFGAGILRAREVKFRVVSGTLQVTTGRRDAKGVIGGNIHAFAVNEPDYMTIEEDIYTSRATSIFIKGTGTIVFTV